MENDTWTVPTPDQILYRGWVTRTDCRKCGITMGYTMEKVPIVRPDYCPDCRNKPFERKEPPRTARRIIKCVWFPDPDDVEGGEGI